jgi:hypothetical protein
LPLKLKLLKQPKPIEGSEIEMAGCSSPGHFSMGGGLHHFNAWSSA